MNDRLFDIEGKIIALLALSESTAEGTEHEAKTALEIAIRLAAKHNISLSGLAQKRSQKTTDWFRGGKAGEAEMRGFDAVYGFDEEHFATIAVQRWCALADKFGWQRHRRSYDKREGMIYAYRMPGLKPKLELRVFDRPWGEVEFEIVRNPDPIIGQYEAWMEDLFDIVALGVTYHDFAAWLEAFKNG
jgi:hypothetical protein